MSKRTGWLSTLGLLALAAGFAMPAQATLLINPGQCDETASRCSASNGVVTAVAFAPVEIHPVNTDPAYQRFMSAFNSWNTGNVWSLAVGTLSAEAVLTIDLYRAYVNEGDGCGISCGGAEISIQYNNGGSAPNPIAGGTINDSDAVWSQSILTNQKRNPSQPGNPYLDNAPGTPDASIGPPAYPFQYNGSSFYDMPSRNAQAYWLGDAWITTADFTDHVLTVYDGVEWGFTVPEPASMALLVVGLGGVGLVRRRRGRSPADVCASAA